MNNNFYSNNIILPTVKYNDYFDNLFSFISKGQFESKTYWHLLVKQFKKTTDNSDYGWRGEFWGKLMRSACLVYSYTQNDKLYNLLTNSVKDILSCQDKFGRISTYKRDREFHGWDMWCRKYVMLGLEYYLSICKDSSLKDKILSSLILHADYIMAHVGENKILFGETSGIWGALNSTSILQPFVKLYKLTLDKKYLEYAEYIVKSNNIEGLNFFYLANRLDIPVHKYPVTKIYEMTSCFEGLLELYEVTKNNEYLLMCENFADKILKDEFTVLGGSGTRSEYFDNCTYRQTIHDPSIEMQETCVTVTMLKYFTRLFFNTQKVCYADAFEKTFYNVYLGAINEDYKKNKRPIFYSYSPIILSPRWKAIGGKKPISLFKICGCCISIGGAGIGTLPKMSAVSIDNVIYINMLCDGKYCFTVNGKNINIEISGAYPDNEKIRISIDSLCKKDIIIKIRKPAWCKKYSFKFEGGNSLTEENGYITFGAKFGKTNALYSLDMPIEFLSSSNFNSLIDYRVYLSRGAISLALDDCKNDNIIPFDTKIKNADIVHNNGKIQYVLPLTNGNKITLMKYSDSAKIVPTETATSVWFRIK